MDKLVAYGGELSYYFKNAIAGYVWSFDDLNFKENLDGDAYPIPYDGKGGVYIDKAPLPRENAKPSQINTTPKYLFSDIQKSLTVFEIKETYGIEDIFTQNVDEYDGWEYVSSFIYKNINISIYTNEKEKINLDNMLTYV